VGGGWSGPGENPRRARRRGASPGRWAPRRARRGGGRVRTNAARTRRPAETGSSSWATRAPASHQTPPWQRRWRTVVTGLAVARVRASMLPVSHIRENVTAGAGPYAKGGGTPPAVACVAACSGSQSHRPLTVAPSRRPANHRWLKTPSASRCLPSSSSWKLPAPPPTASPSRSRRPSPSTRTPRSSSASPDSAASSAPGSWPRSAMTGNGSPTPAA
jgi:hypothetical protein